MEYLLAPDLLGKIIQTIGAIIVAIITKWGVTKVTNKGKSENQKKQLAKGGLQRKSQGYLGWIISGVVAAATFSVVGLVYDTFTPEPTVEITSSKDRESIEVRIANKGSGSFLVDGNSAGVSSKPALRVYVLVHPAEPFAEGWWIQPAVVMNSDGTWSGQAWIGDPSSSPNVGDLIDVLAVVAASDQVKGHTKVNDPKDLNPLARSNTVRINIGSIRDNRGHHTN
jgi:hypothetical protein